MIVGLSPNSRACHVLDRCILTRSSQFHEHLIRKAKEGGKEAAGLLRDSIIKHNGHVEDGTEIIVKVCANLSGLATALWKDGLIGNNEELRDFAGGFSQGHSSFDFVDVGQGKERADWKIQSERLLGLGGAWNDIFLSSPRHLGTTR